MIITTDEDEHGNIRIAVVGNDGELIDVNEGMRSTVERLHKHVVHGQFLPVMSDEQAAAQEEWERSAMKPISAHKLQSIANDAFDFVLQDDGKNAFDFVQQDDGKIGVPDEGMSALASELAQRVKNSRYYGKIPDTMEFLTCCANANIPQHTTVYAKDDEEANTKVTEWWSKIMYTGLGLPAGSKTVAWLESQMFILGIRMRIFPYCKPNRAILVGGQDTLFELAVNYH